MQDCNTGYFHLRARGANWDEITPGGFVIVYWILCAARPEEEAIVCLSTGTTGPQKPIVHTHESMLSLTYNIFERWLKIIEKRRYGI
jgi:acyl-coenzyme A synthetase/AMP-(fatty) acid ligase